MAIINQYVFTQEHIELQMNWFQIKRGQDQENYSADCKLAVAVFAYLVQMSQALPMQEFVQRLRQIGRAHV